ncbi:MAG TPA: methyltransferase domain-containing protein [Ktedonobacteraceae bacterium]|nr:methyltransferase domain-containing protein [Ktedonobacteraceae bacterium]
MSIKKQVRRKTQTQPYLLSGDVLPGLKPFACQEIKNRYPSQVVLQPSDDPASIYFHYTGELQELFSLRTVVAVYLVLRFPIPRPRALLGHQQYQQVLQGIKEVRLLHHIATFSGLRISAAGENSSVFAQLKEQLSQDTGLPVIEEGDLLLRVRPASILQSGWEVLIRLTPRPLSTRPWRVFNMKGALNATVAAAMIELTHPDPTDRFLNLMCGSGTLLVERLQRCPAAVAVGCDLNTEALQGAQLNLERGGVARNVLLFASDATDLPFLPGTFTALCADVPWGQLTGSHQANKTLYPQLLSEAARLAAPHARFILLTHEITLFEDVLQQFSDVWKMQEAIKIFQGGLHPRIYVLQRATTETRSGIFPFSGV